jgi:hypothetical protein
VHVRSLGLFFDFDDFLASVFRKENACKCTSAALHTTASIGQTCVRIDINLGAAGIVLHLVIQVVILKSVI